MADGSVVFNISADDKEAQKKLNQLHKDIEKTAQALDKSQGKRNAIAEQLQTAREEAEKTQQSIKELQEQYQENAGALSGRTGDIGMAEFEARKQAQSEITYELKQQEAARAKQTALVGKLEGQEQTITREIEQQTAKMNALQSEAGEMTRALSAPSSNALPQLKSQIAGVTKQIRKSAKSILKWGFGIRSAFILVRRLRSAIKEGIQAYAEQDETLKANLSGLKNSLTALKASWGAAFAPIINAVTPMLQKLISLLATAAEYVQMFFAALGGATSYKKVIANNNELAKSYGGAGGAAEDAKKQLMGFDEINKLNGESGGGGGGGGSPLDFDTKDQDIPQPFLDKIDWLKEHFNEILVTASAIGTALLAWKIASKLPADMTQFFGRLKMILGVIIAIAGAVLFVKNYFDAWNNGINFDNLLGMLGGVALMVIGLGLAFGTTGAAIGLLIASVAMAVLAFKEWIETGHLSAEAFETLELAIAGVGIAISLLTHSWIPALIAGIVMLVLAIVQNWDEIKKALNAAWEWIVGLANSIWTWVETTANNIANFFKTTWDKIVTGISEMITRVKEKFNLLKTELTQSISRIKTAVINKFNEIKNGIVEKFQAAKDKVEEIVKNIKEFFTTLKIDPPHIKVPHIGVQWEDVSQSSIARLLGITALPHFSVQWMAKGGIVDGATLFGAGEAGREAIVPLERNTEWIDMVVNGLLDRLSRSPVVNGSLIPPRAVNGSMFSDTDIDRLARGIANAFTNGEAGDHSTKLYLDGRQIAEVVTKHQRRGERGYA